MIVRFLALSSAFLLSAALARMRSRVAPAFRCRICWGAVPGSVVGTAGTRDAHAGRPAVEPRGGLSCSTLSRQTVEDVADVQGPVAQTCGRNRGACERARRGSSRPSSFPKPAAS